MSDPKKNIATLSSEKKRALLAQLMQKQNKVGAEKTVALSYAQQRLWFLDKLEHNNPTYNIPAAFRLKGKLNTEILKKCLNEIIRRHEALRTTFSSVDGKPSQVISASLQIELPIVDLTAVNEAEREDRVRAFTSGQAKEPFDLTRGPLIRTTLLRVREDEYVFSVIMHHIIADGWSLGVFITELSDLYQAFSKGDPSPLKELPLQYSDYAVQQRDLLEGKMGAKQLEYWIRQLDGAVPSLDIPTDRPRPPVQTFAGARESFAFSRQLTDKLKELSRVEGATLFMTLMAGLKTLLYRYAGQDDLCVGTPIANRNKSEIEGLIGFFINTLVLRDTLQGETSFRDLLGQVRTTALEAYDHQDVPFEKLVEELHPDRDISRTPLFQVMFSLLNTPEWTRQVGDLKIAAMDLYNGMSKFDLLLYMWEVDGALRGVWEFNTDLFDVATIQRLNGHFQGLFEEIITNPSTPLSAFRLLTDDERNLQGKWNATGRAYERDACLHALFESRVREHPDEIAVRSGETSLTYTQLNTRANHLARYIQKSDAAPLRLVGISMNRSVEMLVAVLAVFKAGAAYVPLDPSYPTERLTYMASDAELKLILTESTVKQGLSLSGDRYNIVCIDEEKENIAQEASDDLENQIDSSSLAYVIYTSGSTGKPKGVEIEHRALINFLTAMADKPGFGKGDVLLAVTTLSFDIAGLELYLPLITGSQSVIVPHEIAADGKKLIKAMAESGATVMQATPATWQMLLDAGWQGQSALRILCGGEAFPRDLAKRLAEKGSEIWNMYGPTEATIWSSVKKVVPSDGAVFIGGPIANTQFHILDAALNLVPIGIYGELHIGGDGLARGYLNRPELTAERFIRNPFDPTGRSRLYKTGDLVRYRMDGSIEFQGRIDHQVKIRGFRIELGEIEAVLSQHPKIEQAVVVARDSEENQGDKRLIAYFIPKTKDKLTTSELRDFLKQQLPDYMVPSLFAEIEMFPLTPNGKVDRKRLPEPEGGRPELGSEYKAPENEIERSIAQVWLDVLKIEKVGVDDNFFDLGGHSLLLVQIQSKLTDLFDREISIVELFQYPTVASLTNYFNMNKSDTDGMQKIQDHARRQKDALARKKKSMKEAKNNDGRLEYA